MESLLANYLTAAPWLFYGLIFLGMMYEGEMVLLLALYYAQQGHLNFAFVLVTVIAGVISGDLLWYSLGRHLDKSNPWVLRWTRRVGQPVDWCLRWKPRQIIFISKFTLGLHRLTLLRAGALPISWRSFLMANISSTLCWVSLIGGLGYGAAAVSGTYLKYYLPYAELVLVLGLALLFILSQIMAKFVQWKVNKNHGPFTPAHRRY